MRARPSRTRPRRRTAALHLKRAAGGVAEGLISLAIGLENVQDVRNDLACGLDAAQ